MHSPSYKAEQLKNLEKGRGIPYLLDEAYKILGNPILIHDMEFKSIDFNRDIVIDDPFWNAYTTVGTINDTLFDFIRDELFVEAAANTKKITYLTSEKLKFNRLYGKIFNKNNLQIGCAIIIACDNSFVDDDPILFELFCDILSEEFGKSDYYNEYGQAAFEKLMNDFIIGVSDKALYAAHAESIYMHLKSNLYLAVVDIGKCDPEYTKLAHYRDLLKQTQSEYAYAVYSNYILIIISTDDPILKVERDLIQLNQLFHKKNIYAGISRSFENLFDINKYYKEALGALNGAQLKTNQHIFTQE